MRKYRTLINVTWLGVILLTVSLSIQAQPEPKYKVGDHVEFTTGTISVPVELTVANFPSSRDAAAAVEAFAEKHGLVVETKSGGKRLTWGDGKSIMWSNGSLQCLATSSFAKTTSNLEEALPF